MTFTELISKLTVSENEGHKCPFCWNGTKDNYCNECDLEIEQIELI